MKVMMLRKADREALPPLYSQDGLGPDAVAYVKWFHPYGSGTWYVTEFDGEDTCFGWVESPLGDPSLNELGYFSLAELTELRARINGHEFPFQAIERDIHFTPTRLGDIESFKRSRERSLA